MSTADISVFGDVRVEDFGLATDFNNWHVCRDLNAIKDWVFKHQVGEDQMYVSGLPGDFEAEIEP